MKQLLIAAAFYLVLWPRTGTAGTPITPSIIDIHCHTAGIGAGGSGCFVSPALRRNWRYHIYLKSFGVTEQELEREGDALILQRLSRTLTESHHVKTAVVLAMDGVVDENGELDRSRTEVYIPNDFLAREAKRYPNLLFGASINPYRKDAIQRLDQAAADGAVLLKWLPSVQEIDPSDRRLIPFYVRLRELGLPLLTHTGQENSFTRKKDELADPERLRLPLSLGVTVIAAHSASNGRNHGEENFKRFLRLCAEYPNLYGDISALTQANRQGQLARLLKHNELHGRLLYGTDMPLITTGITSPWWHTFRIPFASVRRIAAIKNPWDQDVELKQALGVPEEILLNNSKLFHITGR